MRSMQLGLNRPDRYDSRSLRRLIHVAVLTILVVTVAMPRPSQAQTDIKISIGEPAEGANITGPFVLSGSATVPFEKQLGLKVVSTATNEQLIAQPLPVVGEPGQQGTFRVVLNYTVAAATPALIQITATSPKDGSVLAKAEVRVVLRKYDNGQGAPVSGDLAALAAVQQALIDYEVRVQSLTAFPQTVEDRVFTDQCLGLARPGEACAQAEIPGKVVTLLYGGRPFVYNVGNNQARLDESKSAQLTQKPGGNLPKPLAEASTATGIKLYIPQKFSGPFEGLFFRRVDWETGMVTISYGADGNPVDVRLVERAGNQLPAPAHPNGEKAHIGTATVLVQADGGRKYVEWIIQNTTLTLIVPQNISADDLAGLANMVALPGSTPGQNNLLDRTAFGKLTLNLPEPVRSLEMARQALFGLLKPARQGGIIAIQPRQFKDACLDLQFPGDACTGGTTPGFVIGVADSELYRYHATTAQARLNRGNSELKVKGAADFATVEAARGSVQFPIIAVNDPKAQLLAIQTGPLPYLDQTAPATLLLYRDSATEGRFALIERGSAVQIATSPQDEKITVNGVQLNVRNDGNGRTVILTLQSGGKTTWVVLWATPEIQLDSLTRIATEIVTP